MHDPNVKTRSHVSAWGTWRTCKLLRMCVFGGTEPEVDGVLLLGFVFVVEDCVGEPAIALVQKNKEAQQRTAEPPPNPVNSLVGRSPSWELRQTDPVRKISSLAVSQKYGSLPRGLLGACESLSGGRVSLVAAGISFRPVLKLEPGVMFAGR